MDGFNGQKAACESLPLKYVHSFMGSAWGSPASAAESWARLPGVFLFTRTWMPPQLDPPVCAYWMMEEDQSRWGLEIDKASVL